MADQRRYWKNTERFGAAVTFAVALVTYLLTLEPGASYWDCPEYIVTATTLEIGHPPGNPVWSLAMRAATMFVPAGYEACAINACSGFFTALACMLLYLVVFSACRHLSDGDDSRGGALVAGISSLAGSLAFAWCDSVWFSAVEAEVYAMSIFMTAMMLWLMVLWTRCPSTPRGDRLLILIAYLTGLSLGVHQLNLLVIPVLALTWVYVRYPVTTKGSTVVRKGIVAIILSFLTVGGILGVLMPGLLWCAGKTELIAVNGFGMPYNSGVLIFITAVFAIFVVSFKFIRNRRVYSGMWMLAMTCLGYSSFALIMIRAAASPPMNEGVPDNIFALSSYISRDQYGSTPLLHGRTPYSKPLVKETFRDGDSVPDYSRYCLVKGKPVYAVSLPGAAINPRSGMLTEADSMMNDRVENSGHGYYLADYSFRNAFTPELDMWFPRITSSSPTDIESYEAWVGMKRDSMVETEISEAVDSTGNAVGKIGGDGLRHKAKGLRPTYMQNLQYFLGYQIYYMYFRYLLWNFCGRQNDVCSSGEVDHGNFITGITAVDNLMLGAENLLPAELGDDNRGRNAYFGLPLLLGIAGIVWLCRHGLRGRRICTLILLLFLMTGVAIVVYLNQAPGEPRERDYSFLGSYMAFSMWISFGGLAVSRWIGKTVTCVAEARKRTVAAAVAAVALVGVPLIMFAVNIDDHDRSERRAVDDFSRNVLESMPPRAILFVEGDNYTFPLWYAQETLGIRTDVTVVNCSYLALPSYRATLMQEGRGGEKLRSGARLSDIIYGKYAYTRIARDADTTAVTLEYALKELFRTCGSPEFHHSRVRIAVSPDDSVTIDLRSLLARDGRGSFPFSRLAMLDIIGSNASVADNPRPVVFRTGVPKTVTSPIEEYLRDGLHGRIYWPQASDSQLSDMIYRGAMSMLDGGFRHRDDGRYPYCDPTLASMLRRQRVAMLSGAEILLKEGKPEQAREMLLKSRDLFPDEGCGFSTFVRKDSVRYEAREYSRLLREVADSLDDNSLREMASAIDRDADARRREYLRYVNGMPSRLRPVLSYETLRKTKR